MTNLAASLAFLVLSSAVVSWPSLAMTAPRCDLVFRSRVEPTAEQIATRQRLANRFRNLSPVEGDMVYAKDADAIFIERSPILQIGIRTLYELQDKFVSKYKTEDIEHEMTMTEYWFSHETRYGNRVKVDRHLSLPSDIVKYEGRLVYGTYFQYFVAGRPVTNREFSPNIAYDKSANDPALGQPTGLRAKVRSFMGIIHSAQAVKFDGEVVLQITVEDASGQLLKLTSFNNDFHSGDILSINEVLIY